MGVGSTGRRSAVCQLELGRTETLLLTLFTYTAHASLHWLLAHDKFVLTRALK